MFKNIKIKLYLLALFLCCACIAFKAKAANSAADLETAGKTTVELLTELQQSIDGIYKEAANSDPNAKIDWAFIGEFGKLYGLNILELRQLTPLQKSPKVGAAMFLEVGAEYLVKNLEEQIKLSNIKNNTKLDGYIKQANAKLNQIKNLCKSKLSSDEKNTFSNIEAGTVCKSLKNNSTNTKLKRLFEITKDIPDSLKKTINRGIDLLK